MTYVSRNEMVETVGVVNAVLAYLHNEAGKLSRKKIQGYISFAGRELLEFAKSNNISSEEIAEKGLSAARERLEEILGNKKRKLKNDEI